MVAQNEISPGLRRLRKASRVCVARRARYESSCSVSILRTCFSERIVRHVFPLEPTGLDVHSARRDPADFERCSTLYWQFAASQLVRSANEVATLLFLDAKKKLQPSRLVGLSPDASRLLLPSYKCGELECDLRVSQLRRDALLLEQTALASSYADWNLVQQRTLCTSASKIASTIENESRAARILSPRVCS
jgi:hypothetical protein